MLVTSSLGNLKGAEVDLKRSTHHNLLCLCNYTYCPLGQMMDRAMKTRRGKQGTFTCMLIDVKICCIDYCLDDCTFGFHSRPQAQDCGYVLLLFSAFVELFVVIPPF